MAIKDSVKKVMVELNKDNKMDVKLYEGFEKKFEMSPANTVEGWNYEGFSVPKGTKQVGYVQRWRPETKVPENEKQYIKKRFTNKEGTEMAMTYACIFTIEQVHPKANWMNKTYKQMIDFINKPKKGAK